MTSRRVAGALAIIAVAALFYWVSTHTYWADVEVPLPPRGEARTNPTYAAQRLVERLGAHATRDVMLTLPPPSSAIVLSRWTWDLSETRRTALEHWVESGGRLIIDSTVHTEQEFEDWSGIGFHYLGIENEDDDNDKPVERCRRLNEERSGRRVADAHWACDFDTAFSLTTRRPAEWILRDAMSGVQVVRVRVGRGSVTTVNGNPFTYRQLFDGDHGWLLVRATALQQGDDVHFVSEREYPSLLALTWQRGQPVVILGLALIGCLLWRGGSRFGPLAAAAPTSRRSLAEQIRGTAQFTMQHGGGESLHAACVRALDEVARRRIAGYPVLAPRARAEAVAAASGVQAAALAAAMYQAPARGTHELRSTIALLETARRRLLLNKARTSHGH